MHVHVHLIPLRDYLVNNSIYISMLLFLDIVDGLSAIEAAGKKKTFSGTLPHIIDSIVV